MAPQEPSQKGASEDDQPVNSGVADSSGHGEDKGTSDPAEGQSSQSTQPARLAHSGTRPGTTYGSISSYDTAPIQRAGDEVREREQAKTPYSPNFPTGGGEPSMSPLSPQLSAKPRKPATLRRTSTKRGVPYRGQEFSVDDDPSELERDELEHEHTSRATGSTTLKRQASTLRRRPTATPAILARLDSEEEETQTETQRPSGADDQRDSPEETEEPEDYEDEVGEDYGDEEEHSDAESFTLRDRQLAINQTHPFGIRIWKPALYKKNRSVEKGAEEDIRSTPSAQVTNWLAIFNVIWTLLFGWWLAILALLGSFVCFLFSMEPSSLEYGRVLASLAWYLVYPFGQFVKLESDENYAEEDEGEGRSISEYERWQSGDLEHGRLFFGPIGPLDRSIVGRRRNSIDSVTEHDSLLGRTGRANDSDPELQRVKRRRLFGRGQWTLGRVVFFASFYVLVAPFMLLTSGICWLMVFWIPMGRVMLILLNHLRRHPLALTFHSDITYSRSTDAPSSVLVCTYRAVGLKYWKYTVDGTNIFLINLLAIVLFTIIDYFILDVALDIENFLTDPAFIFPMALFSVIPLAYFIGQAVASISAQSSMGLGAVVNAFFSTIVEVYLYCIALKDGKGQLVEGSVIGR